MKFNAKILKDLRSKENLTLSELADIIGSHRQTVWSWEAGQRVPNGNHLMALSSVFNVPADYFFNDHGYNSNKGAA